MRKGKWWFVVLLAGRVLALEREHELVFVLQYRKGLVVELQWSWH
jgi:hypothetical protein